MNGIQIKESLKQGHRIYGTLISSYTPFWAKAVQSIGLDFVFIDTEHLPIDRTELSWMCTLYESLGIAPIVRIPAPDPYQASMVIDGNATGVIAPYIETPEQVLQLVGAVKYKPLKGDRLQEVLGQQVMMDPPLSSYIRENNQDRIVIINIESKPAIEALDNILAIEGLDAILVGPHDLSCSLGIPEQYDHPLFIDTVDMIIDKAKSKNIGAGIHMIYEYGLDQEIIWAQKGANLILHSADIISFTQGIKRDLNQIKQTLGDVSIPSKESTINI